jgi:hypothetical protein
VFGRFAQDFFRCEPLLVQSHARVAIAFHHPLDPQEDLGVHGLRTGIAAPQASGHRGEEKQRQGADDEQDREVDDVLRPEHQAEQVELAVGDVEQQRLALVPGEPGAAVEHELRRPDQRPAPGSKPAAHRARIDLLADLEERLLDPYRDVVDLQRIPRLST